jgi:hypothetical protein
MTLKIYIFQLFVLFKCKNVKQKDPDKFFREMSHLKAHNFLNILAQFLFVDHEFWLNPSPAFRAVIYLLKRLKYSVESHP